MELSEAIRTQRAIRHFSDRPVSDETVRTLMEAATSAPNAGNRQQWRFLVVRDREAKRRFGDWYLRAWTDTVSRIGDEANAQPYRSGGVLGEQMENIPVLVLACIAAGSAYGTGNLDLRGASIYPAVQNLMLTARSLGLGTVITTMHTQFESEVKQLLGIPDEFDTAALIPVGYPARGVEFGDVSRGPLDDVVFQDRWANPLD
ncbi:MAG: nitroreductase family protein [SAR202 cluster bacterium]|jgi:nitroreductase|nr:nitroreductase family protein [SAR202 cluster bacterium]MDP6514754.1 nitroreductase family protein [SAR202 cluster bacterium]MDP6716192.1 nitroreductase family protein [SAR202 cluster bacterium]